MKTLTVQDVRLARRMVHAGVSMREIVPKIGKPYAALWFAVTGKTWKHITDPPPVSSGVLQARRKLNGPRICPDCSEPYTGYGRFCSACVSFRYRNGEPRGDRRGHKKRVLVDPVRKQLDQARVLELYRLYMSGKSVQEVADYASVNSETLRRRFEELSLPRREVGRERVLTAGMVAQARLLVNREGVSASELAKQWGISYQTLHSAVRGYTWRTVGGPLPERKTEKRPCTGCDLLTDHPSGVCVWCRNGK